jgi:sec-independent protein translocase protein TatA
MSVLLNLLGHFPAESDFSQFVCVLNERGNIMGTQEIVLIVLALVLLFGASRLPQFAKSLGQTRKAFKDGMKEAEEEERLEAEQKQIKSVATPQITQMSDDALMDEMRRRTAEKNV